MDREEAIRTIEAFYPADSSEANLTQAAPTYYMTPLKGGVCMKGSIQFRKDRGRWVVRWYVEQRGRSIPISRYKGELMYSKKIAQKLLATMQADVEAGTFRLERYTGKGWTDVIPYLREWLEAIKHTLSPATIKDYRNSIENHMIFC